MAKQKFAVMISDIDDEFESAFFGSKEECEVVKGKIEKLLDLEDIEERSRVKVEPKTCTRKAPYLQHQISRDVIQLEWDSTARLESQYYEDDGFKNHDRVVLIGIGNLQGEKVEYMFADLDFTRTEIWTEETESIWETDEDESDEE